MVSPLWCVVLDAFGSLVRTQEIDAIIIGLYNEIVNTSGVAEQDVKREQGQPEIPVAAPPPQPAQVQASTNGHAPQRTGSRPSSSARPAPPASDATSDEDEDEGDGSGSDFEEEERKPSTSKAKLKASPQKRRLQEDPIPASSPPVPLAMATGMTDEEYARQLQEEMNAAARGRSTRGGGFQKRSKKGRSKKNGSTSNGGGGKKKYRTKDYIDDSDAGEGHDGSEEDDDDGDSDSNAGSDKPKKAKKRSGGGGGGSGGYMKELALSEPLQRVCGAPTVSLRQPSVAGKRLIWGCRWRDRLSSNSYGHTFARIIYKIQQRSPKSSTMTCSSRSLA